MIMASQMPNGPSCVQLLKNISRGIRYTHNLMTFIISELRVSPEPLKTASRLFIQAMKTVVAIE